jgi:hypothetical protein
MHMARRLLRQSVWRQNRRVLVCAEWGRVAEDEAGGWRAYREDVPGEDDSAGRDLCPLCAAREFDAESAE